MNGEPGFRPGMTPDVLCETTLLLTLPFDVGIPEGNRLHRLVASALKNRVHAQLARHGVHNGHSDLFGKRGREFLAELAVREPPRRRLDSLLSLIGDFDREIESATQEIDALAKAHDRVAVLTQIRGVGRYAAMLVIAEIGDISRFPSAREVCAWAADANGQKLGR